MTQIELIATTTFGMETVVKHELLALGYDELFVENGKITFKADLADIPRTNLWLRAADRVKWKVGAFRAVTFEELFERTKDLPWGDLLPKNASFPVTGKSVKSTLFSVSDCQAITKKAIVEKMKQQYGLQWYPEDGPIYRIEVALLKDEVTLSIDTSGEGLHKRGYRYLHTEAPLKETMAAGMIQLSRWKPGRPLWDPFCGSGTFPIEAAMMARNMAPGLNRSFVSQYWPNISMDAWEKSLDEAFSVMKAEGALSREECRIYGSDKDPEAIRLSMHNAEQAEVGQLITFERRAFHELKPEQDYGYCYANPPYGERLGEKSRVEQLYRQMGEFAGRQWPTWSMYIFTAHSEFEKLYGKKADKKRKLFSGNILCHFYQFFGPKPPRETSM